MPHRYRERSGAQGRLPDPVHGYRVARGHDQEAALCDPARATIAYLGDVFVLPEHRGAGLGKWLMDGFTPLAARERFMERHDPEVVRSKETRRDL